MMDEKLAQAIAYLRSRRKYVVDPTCTFRPTPSTDRFSILERYGKEAPCANECMRTYSTGGETSQK